jgi:uncharacterized SAM-binding protein YcdF (DUF218 family)
MNEVSFGIYRKLIFLVSTGIVLLLVLCFGIPSFLGPSNKLQKADAIVAISGGDTGARTAEAVRLQKAGYASALIFSGAALDPNSPSNAAAMRQGAIAAGVDASDINVEELARDTLENASDTAAIINNNHYKTIILVTSQYHQRRAYLEFHHLLGNGVKIINHPAPGDQHWPGRDWWLHPSSLILGISETIKAAYVWVNYTFNQ